MCINTNNTFIAKLMLSSYLKVYKAIIFPA